ncbi:MAG: hypothetical protein A7315_07230 [Candidatus Altiarchaeales archaeon WOR_SM1_79]|nr:MAG: hypothetical protein A7315_07230 [Candidatus Altiarchaeales archaeon WOR_SM1_79]
MASSAIKERIQLISIILCILGLVLIILSQTIYWIGFNVDTSIGGIADIELDAKFYEAKVDYEAKAKVEDTGGLGGIIGGFIGIGGILGEGGNISIPEDTIYYVEGLGKFQDLVGLMYGTTKNADYWIKPITDNSSNTRVIVNTHTDLIPWWPDGLAQEMTITVALNQTDNIKNVRINEVWIEAYTDWDDKERKYTSQPLELWKIKPGDYLYKVGDKKEYKHGIAVEKEWGDRIGLIAMVDITMTDIYNETNYDELKPFPHNSPPQEMVNIIPITQGQSMAVVLLVLSFPMAIFGIILIIVAMILIIFQKRRRAHVLFTAALVEWFAVIFFVIGASTLVSLIEFVKAEWVSWNIIGLILPILAGAVLFVAFLLEMIFGAKEEAPSAEKEIKFDISAAMAEEEAAEGEEEEEEAFQCPKCGKVFTEMVSSCPECGAEFEGYEEEEEDKGVEDEEGDEGEEEEGIKESKDLAKKRRKK